MRASLGGDQKSHFTYQSRQTSNFGNAKTASRSGMRTAKDFGRLKSASGQRTMGG